MASGNFTTTAGSLRVNRTFFDCSGEELIATVVDENGSMADPGCGDPTEPITVTFTTTTPDASFTADLEIVELTGAEPIWSMDEGYPVIVVASSDQVVQGDGIIQIAEGEPPLTVGVLDPLGAAHPPGPEAYFLMMESNARALTECLGPHRG